MFRSSVVGGRVPQEYVRAVEACCRDALTEGLLGGHPVTGLRVTLTDGATHSKDSSEMAFRTAGRLALREALRNSTMVLLEPVVEVTVTVPDDAVGGVLGDLAARRGRVSGSTARAGDVGGHRDRAAGGALRLRDPAAQPDAGPGNLHHPGHRLRPGAGRGTPRDDGPVAPGRGPVRTRAGPRHAHTGQFAPTALPTAGATRSTAVAGGGGSAAGYRSEPVAAPPPPRLPERRTGGSRRVGSLTS